MDLSTNINIRLPTQPDHFYGKSRIQMGDTTEQRDATSTHNNDGDVVTLSQEGQDLAKKLSPDKNTDNSGIKTVENLDEQELQELQQLKIRDSEVRAHEQAHLASAGQYARGGASFTFQKGPNGVSYAVGGEVGIDVGREKTPEATISKMQIIKRAALAPASPSAADRSIAAKARLMESQARQELLMKRQEELLQAKSEENPIADQAVPPTMGEKGGDTSSSFVYGTLRATIAAYRRNAGNN